MGITADYLKNVTFLYVKELGRQRDLGSCDTAEEAAAVLAAANDKLKRKEAVWEAPVKKQAKHGSVRCACRHPLPCTSAHEHSC